MRHHRCALRRQHGRHPRLPLGLEGPCGPEHTASDRYELSATDCAPDDCFAPTRTMQLREGQQRMLAAGETVEFGIHGRRYSQPGVTRMPPPLAIADLVALSATESAIADGARGRRRGREGEAGGVTGASSS